MIERANEQTSTSARPTPFNPNEHLMQIKSRNGAADYLPVQWRIAWFREKFPHGTIDTEEIEVDLDRVYEEEVYQWNNETRRSEKVIKRAAGYARYKAIVTDGLGGRATGTKTEKAVSFPDFIEKAETGSIGRALANLGYGTQFCGDEFDERLRIVDAPVDRGAAAATQEHDHEQKAAPAASTTRSQRKAGEEDDSVTEQQWGSIRNLCGRLGKAVPEETEVKNYLAAKELIAQLSQEFRASRSKAS